MNGYSRRIRTGSYETVQHGGRQRGLCESKSSQKVTKVITTAIVYLGCPIAPSYMSPYTGGGAGSQPMCTASCTDGAQINFEDQTSYLTYGWERICTAKTKCRKFETNIPWKGISGSQSKFPHSCVCERIIYSHDGSAFSAGGNIWTDPGGWEYINRSETHECGNWGWGRAIPRKGIYKWNCGCSALKVVQWYTKNPIV